jgi:hypothetical protein
LNAETIGFFVNPIRSITSVSGFNALYYNPTTNEIGYFIPP